MKTNDAWNELKTLVTSWKDMYALMNTPECSHKRWLCESFLKAMNGLEDKHE